MYTVETRDFSNKDFDNWDLPFDYHCVYILENGKEAYVGETKNPITRSTQHMSNAERNRLKKYQFTKIHIMSGLRSTETPAKHYEFLLIKLMRVDGKYTIVNHDDGEKQHYYEKNEFELYFDQLWLKLAELDLVRTKEFQLIINSNSYKYSPYTILTQAQHNALTSIVHTIDSEETMPHDNRFKARPILVSGDAGTGKTVVATSLFYYLKTHEQYKNKKIGLVYANTSTRSEIQTVFKNVDGIKEKDVISPIDVTKQYYDIIICDESQRLRQGKNLGLYFRHFKQGNERLDFDDSHNELDWLLTNSGCQILFYDEKQSTGPSDVDTALFDQTLHERWRGIRPIRLSEQMRIRAGNRYVPYIYDLLYQRKRTKEDFENYEFKLFTSFSELCRQLDQKEKKVGLCRYCSGYPWKWNSKKDKSQVDIILDGVKMLWNSQTGGWLSNPALTKEMGSIYTLAGLDLNYTGVVIGPDLYYDKSDEKIKVNRKCYFDDKVKKGVSDDELIEYVLNTYAVLLTRGIQGTYLYVCDDNLREYMKKFIHISN